MFYWPQQKPCVSFNDKNISLCQLEIVFKVETFLFATCFLVHSNFDICVWIKKTTFVFSFKYCIFFSACKLMLLELHCYFRIFLYCFLKQRLFYYLKTSSNCFHLIGKIKYGSQQTFKGHNKLETDQAGLKNTFDRDYFSFQHVRICLNIW